MALLLSIVTGCILPPQEPTIDIEDNKALIPVSQQLLAIEYEDNEQYLDAHSYWQETKKIVNLKIAFLVLELKQISNGYAQRGVAFYDAKKGTEALLVFLEALRYDPSNPVALDYLHNRYEAERFIRYPVKSADSFASIAETVYGSNTYEFIVAQFSDAGKEIDLQEGLLITLPQLDSYFSQPLKDYRKNLRDARKFFKAGEFVKALPIARTILANHPETEEASFIINRSLLKIAEKQRSDSKFDAAVRTLSMVDPSFKNIKSLVENIKKQQQEETRLANTSLFESGQRYYAKNDYLKALDAFLQVAPHYDGVQKAIIETRQKMQIEADFHFKEGVKLFVEEKLTAAIAEWQKTLKLSPDHPDAITSIEKARKLLEKVQKIN